MRFTLLLFTCFLISCFGNKKSAKHIGVITAEDTTIEYKDQYYYGNASWSASDMREGHKILLEWAKNKYPGNNEDVLKAIVHCAMEDGIHNYISIVGLKEDLNNKDAGRNDLVYPEVNIGSFNEAWNKCADYYNLKK